MNIDMYKWLLMYHFNWIWINMEKYELVKDNIGKGTFGQVSLVNHLPSNKQMVWKKINYGQLREKEIH